MGFFSDLFGGGDEAERPAAPDLSQWHNYMRGSADQGMASAQEGKQFAQNFYNQAQPQIGQYQQAILGDVNRLGGLANQVVGLGDESARLVRGVANPAYERMSRGLGGYATDPWALGRGEQLASAAGALTSKNRGMAMREAGRRMMDPRKLGAALATGAQQGIADEVGGYNTGYMSGLNEQYGRDQLTWQQRPQDWMQAYGLGGNMTAQGAGLRGNALNAGLPFAQMGMEGYKLPMQAAGLGIQAGQGAVGGLNQQYGTQVGMYNAEQAKPSTFGALVGALAPVAGAFLGGPAGGALAGSLFGGYGDKAGLAAGVPRY